MREIHGRLCFSLSSGGGNALIESHHDVAADCLLHCDARFRREEIRFSVYITLKASPLFVQFPGVRQRKNLKSAGVGKYRAVPVHETVNAAELFEDFRSGAKEQMVGINKKYTRSCCF